MSEAALNAKVAKDAKDGVELTGSRIVNAAIRVHSALGPGLLESAYEACMAHELAKTGSSIRRQVALPIAYDGERVEAGFRIDLLVDEAVVVELKAIDRINPVHPMQVLTYLRLGGYRLGFLLNFNVARMREGIKRIANGL